MTALKALCTLLITSLHYNILFLFPGFFINVDAIIYLQLCNKNEAKKGFKIPVNTQLLILQEMT